MPLLTVEQLRDFNLTNRKRLRFERQFDQIFKKWGRSVAKNMVQNRITTGFIGPELRDDLWNILQNHYLKVMNSFTKFDFAKYHNNITAIDEIQNIDERNAIGEIVTKLTGLMYSVGGKVYFKILETTRKNILDAIEQTTELLKSKISFLLVKQEEEGITPQQLRQIEKLLRISTGILRARLAARAKLIGVTETTWAIEAARFSSTETATKSINKILTEVNDLVGEGKLSSARKKLEGARKIQDFSNSRAAVEVIDMAEGGINEGRKRKTPIQVVVFKTWITRFDDRVRATHRKALGQRVRDDEPFLVGDSKLMYPRDISLQPESKEVVNCRCWVHYD